MTTTSGDERGGARDGSGAARPVAPTPPKPTESAAAAARRLQAVADAEAHALEDTVPRDGLPRPTPVEPVLPAAPTEDETPSAVEAPTVAAEPSPAQEGAAQSAPQPPAVEPEPPAARPAPAPRADAGPVPADAALALRGVVKTYGGEPAVAGIDLTVPRGSFYGLVGPNGAGKTTTLSMISGLVRPDKGEITVFDVDARRRPRQAKELMGVLPDRMRTFDRLTGRQLLHYFGALRRLSPKQIRTRTDDLVQAFDLEQTLGRQVADFSTGMTKKLMLACAMIHGPRLVVLDEPFESVDPVSSQKVRDVLDDYVAGGGTVLLSGHSMDLIETMCSRIAVLVTGQVLAEGSVDEVRGEVSLEQRFIDLSGAEQGGGLEWLHTSSA